MNAVRAPAQKAGKRVSNSEFREKNQFTLTVKCHWCGHQGLTLWEKTVEGRRQFVSLEGFYERVANKEPFKVETVCNNCDRVQPV